MIIKGANLGNQEVEFKKITDTDWDIDEKGTEALSLLEDMYIKIYNQRDKQMVSSMATDSNRKVVITKGMTNHRCAGDMATLEQISKYGLLASEWFGVLESEQEGCFCTFVSRMKGEDYRYRGDLAEDDHSRLNIGSNYLLFFDDNNPIMEYLLHLDYFEYENIKNNTPEEIEKIYTSEEIAILDNLIEPLSPGGQYMRSSYDSKTNYWSAIPGGIPPYLVNGICTKNAKLTEEELNQINEMFPIATIFNSELEILRNPLNKEEINGRTI